MARLDRLGWAAGLVVNVQGARIGVRVNAPEALPGLTDRLPISWKEDADQQSAVDELFSVSVNRQPDRAGVRRFNLFYRGVIQVVRTLEIEELLDRFEKQLHSAIATSSPRYFIHAGVVGWHGKALLFPGPTLAGKTTLVRALVDAGAEYLSDEFAVLDDLGLVHPYLKPLGVRLPGGLHQTRLSITDLNGRVAQTPLPVGAVIVTQYREGAGTRLAKSTTGHGLLELLKHTVVVHSRAPQALAALKLAMSSAVCLSGPRGEAGQAAARLLGTLISVNTLPRSGPLQ